MIRKIVTYPSAILRKKSRDVEEFNEELHTLLDDMNETMLTFAGVGLAAIQVGIDLNILIINIPIKDDVQLPENLIEAVNPTVISKSGVFVFNEGCLSVPTIHEEIKRSKYIEVEYFDRFGTKQYMKCEGFLAVAWQHEIEHLSGHLFIENLSITKRRKFEKEYKKAQKKRR